MSTLLVEIVQMAEGDRTKFDSYAWPGGYQIVYYCADGGILCPDCVRDPSNPIIISPGKAAADACPDDRQWTVIAAEIFYEGPPEICAHCGEEIESAYGDPDAE